MNTPKLAIAMNYIDENLISGAIDYKPVHCKNNTYFWKHIAAAACFCIIVIGSIFAYHQHTQPEDMTDLHEITQGGVNAEIIRASGFELFNRVEVEESQLRRSFYSDETLPTYAAVRESIFDRETVTLFAENAASAGWLTDYSIEYNDGVYSIISNDSSRVFIDPTSMGGHDIADQFLDDAGISQWLNEHETTVKWGDQLSDGNVPAKYYHLIIDGNEFADNIQLVIDDGVFIKCSFDIREYERTEANVTLIPFAEAIKDTFSISAIGADHSLEIYHAQLCYVSGMPVYMLSGVSDDKTPVTACAFAIEINDSQYAAQIYEALK